MDTVEIQNVTKRFGSVEALKNISFSIKKGQIFGFLGPNGAGKSTTIRILMGFLHATHGKVSIFGLDALKDAVEIKKHIGYVAAEPILYPDWTVDDHIRFLANIRGTQIIAKAVQLKKALDLDGKKKLKQLSTGNQQKLAIILALAIEPALLVLDEPTRGLDPLLRSTFHNLLREYRDGGGTILLSSHDLSEVEDLCDKIVIIHNGRIVQDTTVNHLRSKHGHKVKAHFLDATPDFTHLKNVDDLVTTKHTAVLTIKGSLRPVLETILKGNLEDLEIASASLEDVFEEIYK